MKKNIILSIILFFTIHSQSIACSSCGSGGNDPLILYPTDMWRIYTGASLTRYSENINHNGNEERNIALQEKRTFLLSVGRRISDYSFFTVSIPHITNLTNNKNFSGQGDPSLSFRYTLFRQNLINPELPQVQLLAGYTPTTTASKYNNKDQRYFSDVLGSGFNEMRIGFDIWSAMSAFNWGFSYNYVFATGSQKFASGTWEQGAKHLSNITVGYYFNNFRAITGVVRSQIEKNKLNNELVNDSDSLSHDGFLTLSYRPYPLDEIRSTWVNRAMFFNNKQTSKNNTLTLAYMRTL